MGFRCPICMKDFGKEKEEWEKHIAVCGNGVAKDIVDCVIETTETKKEVEE